MHGLAPSSHDHGASLDAASVGLHADKTQQQPHLIHSLVEAIRDHISLDPEAKMPTASNLAELKSRLCHREGLNQEQCEKALLPTLEHASLVHSHIHHMTDQSDEAFVQTRNAIVYISLVVVVYVIVVLWLVSANFRSSLSSMAGQSRNVLGHMVGPFPSMRDDGELESLIVVRDRGDKKDKKPHCSTELDHEDDGDYV